MNLCLLLLFLNIACLWANSGIEDRILQEREARLEAIGGDFNPLRETSRTSALAGAEIRPSGIELTDPSLRTRSYSLQEVIQMALTQSKELKQAQLEQNIHKHRERLASDFQKLNVDVISGYNRADNSGQDPRTALNRSVMDLTNLENSFYAGMEASLPIYDSGRGVAKNRIAEYETAIVGWETKKSQMELLLDVARSFMVQIQMREEIALLELEVELGKERVNEAQRVNRDDRMPLELLKLQLELRQNEDELALRRIQEQNLRFKFKNQIGLEETTEYGLLKQAKTKILSEPLAGLRAILMEFSPDLKILELREKIVRERYLIANTNQQPEVDLLSKATYARHNEKTASDEVRWLVGVEFGLNILDGKKTRNLRRIENDSQSILAHEKELVLNRLTIELSESFQRYVEGQNRVDANAKQLKLARSILFEGEERFRQNRILRQELLEVRISYRKALYQYYSVLKDMILAKLQVFALIGKLDETIF
ncbi:MAG: TolC family protein [Candidatus Cloacimonetes bacterium]|nr:TolC family protein [Candidatus Cloacimonadota bacterium]